MFGFRVQGPGFRIPGSGFRVSGCGFRALNFGFRVRSGFLLDPDITCKVSSPGDTGVGHRVAVVGSIVGKEGRVAHFGYPSSGQICPEEVLGSPTAGPTVGACGPTRHLKDPHGGV